MQGVERSTVEICPCWCYCEKKHAKFIKSSFSCLSTLSVPPTVTVELFGGPKALVVPFKQVCTLFVTITRGTVVPDFTNSGCPILKRVSECLVYLKVKCA